MEKAREKMEKETAWEKIAGDVKEIVKKLVANAKALNELSRQEIIQEELLRLQELQDDLIQQLVAKDKLWKQMEKQEGKKEWPLHCKGEIQDLLKTFEELNQNFINNLKVRKGLIQFDLDEIQKNRLSLTHLKEGYSKDAKGKGRVDTRL